MREGERRRPVGACSRRRRRRVCGRRAVNPFCSVLAIFHRLARKDGVGKSDGEGCGGVTSCWSEASRDAALEAERRRGRLPPSSSPPLSSHSNDRTGLCGVSVAPRLFLSRRRP